MTDAGSTATAMLEARGISKRFPGVRALDAVDFGLFPGEVHVLLGENGAGKSTLVKILSGAYQPDEGELWLDGAPAKVTTPSTARQLGIATVYQELSLVPRLTIAQNIFLGRELVWRRPGLLRSAAMNQEARRLLRSVDLDLDPSLPVWRLSLAIRQVVEIVKALAQRARVVIFDEPTSALSAHEAEELFGRIRRLREDGAAICYISHRMDELARVADRVTVMRDGRVVASRLEATTPVSELVRLMVGRDVTDEFPRRSVAPGPVLLDVDRLCVARKVSDVSFGVRAGEVLGIFGLVGAGRTELLRGLFGVERGTTGHVKIKGRAVQIGSARQAIGQGIGLVPEDRHAQGLVLGMSVEQNLALASLSRCTTRGFLSMPRVRDLARGYIDRLHIKVANPRVRVGALSGGNQQKVVIGRSLATGAEAVLLDEPTRGVDVGAKWEIYDLINRLAAEGRAVVLVSSELPEILGMSDRILVMRQGRVAGVFEGPSVTPEALLAAALPIETAEAA